MAQAIRHGPLMRTKSGDLPLKVAVQLLNNPEELQKMYTAWDERRELCEQQEKLATEEIGKLRKQEDTIAIERDGLSEREAELTDRATVHEAKHKSDMGALGRRTTEVFDRERAANDHTDRLDSREKEIERLALERETELLAREQDIIAREDVLSGQEEEIKSRLTEAGRATARIELISKQVQGLVAKA